jgi:transcriptional regulator with XRE-family HTH domain
MAILTSNRFQSNLATRGILLQRESHFRDLAEGTVSRASHAKGKDVIIVKIGRNRLRIRVAARPEAAQSMHRSQIGERIRRARVARGVSEASLAMAVDMPCAAIVDYERGASQPTLSVIATMAEALGMRPEALAFELRTLPALDGVGDALAAVPVFASIDDQGASDLLGVSMTRLAEVACDPMFCEAYRLDRDAPGFSLQAGDYVVVDAAVRAVRSRHDCYLLRSCAGVELVRVEANIAGNKLLCLSGGRGQTYHVPEAALSILGAVIWTVGRC